MNIVGGQLDATTGGPNQGIFLKYILCLIINTRGSVPGGSEAKNLPTNTGDTGDVVSIPGLGRSPGEGKGNPSCILAWEIPRAEGPVGYSLWGHKSRQVRNHKERLQFHNSCPPPSRADSSYIPLSKYLRKVTIKLNDTQSHLV